MPSLFKNILSLICIFAMGSAVALTGCKQDPLDGFDKSVRKPIPPNKKPDGGVKSGELIIDTNDMYDTREGAKLQMGISGHTTLPGRTFTIAIRNAESFPGAVYDPANQILTWDVPQDYVKNADYDLIQMTVYIATNEEPILYNEKVVHVRIFRNVERPEVISIGALGEIEEEDAERFEVVVKSADELSKPSIVVVPVSNYNSGAGFISIQSGPVRDSVDPTLWKFSLSVSLYDQEVTKKRETLSFGIQATSSMGMQSLVVDSSFVARTKLAEPETTWDSYPNIKFKKGERKVHMFAVYDPKFEGEINVDTTEVCKNLPGAICSCDFSAGMQQCSIDWTPNAAGKFSVYTTVTNEISFGSNKYETESTISRSIEVTEGAR